MERSSVSISLNVSAVDSGASSPCRRQRHIIRKDIMERRNGSVVHGSLWWKTSIVVFAGIMNICCRSTSFRSLRRNVVFCRVRAYGLLTLASRYFLGHFRGDNHLIRNLGICEKSYYHARSNGYLKFVVGWPGRSLWRILSNSYSRFMNMARAGSSTIPYFERQCDDKSRKQRCQNDRIHVWDLW